MSFTGIGAVFRPVTMRDNCAQNPNMSQPRPEMVWSIGNIDPRGSTTVGLTTSNGGVFRPWKVVSGMEDEDVPCRLDTSCQ